jgi:hypothetical protein
MTLLQVFSARLRLAAKLLEEEDELLVDSVELKGRLWLVDHHRGLIDP